MGGYVPRPRLGSWLCRCGRRPRPQFRFGARAAGCGGDREAPVSRFHEQVWRLRSTGIRGSPFRRPRRSPIPNGTTSTTSIPVVPVPLSFLRSGTGNQFRLRVSPESSCELAGDIRSTACTSASATDPAKEGQTPRRQRLPPLPSAGPKPWASTLHWPPTPPRPNGQHPAESITSRGYEGRRLSRATASTRSGIVASSTARSPIISARPRKLRIGRPGTLPGCRTRNSRWRLPPALSTTAG